MGTSETGFGGIASGETGTSGATRGPAVRGRERDTPHDRPVQRRAAGVVDRVKREPETLSTFLAWFSIGLGLAQLVAPGGVARLVGIRDDSRSRSLMRALGLRELTSGVGILAKPDSAAWMWSRVAGDTMDLALLGRAMTSDGERGRTAGATAAVLGVTALDVLAAQQLQSREAEAAGKERGIHTRRSITVRRPVAEVYAFWRRLENLPRFMRHLESVRETGPRTSHWVATAPAGKTVEWDAEIVAERENELISWRSLEGADVHNEGTVTFRAAPGGRGTELHVDLRYDPPGGKLASKLAMLFREEPGQQVQDDLRRFKQVMELGEVVVSDATYRKGPHPAQPPADEPTE